MRVRMLESLIRDCADVRIWVPVVFLRESTRTADISVTIGPSVVMIVGAVGTETHVSFDVQATSLRRWLTTMPPDADVEYFSDCSRDELPIGCVVVAAPRHQVMHGFDVRDADEPNYYAM